MRMGREEGLMLAELLVYLACVATIMIVLITLGIMMIFDMS